MGESNGLNRALCRVLNLPPSVVEVVVTSDGFYLGRQVGHGGFNLFLGKPRPGEVGKTAARAAFEGLRDDVERDAVRDVAELKGVDLAAFGIE